MYQQKKEEQSATSEFRHSLQMASLYCQKLEVELRREKELRKVVGKIQVESSGLSLAVPVCLSLPSDSAFHHEVRSSQPI